MKKTFLLFVIGLVSLSATAQDTKQKVKYKPEYHHEAGVSSWYGFGDNYGLYLLDRNENIPTKNLWGIGLYELHGIRFNPHFILSAEISAKFHYSYADHNSFHDGITTPCDVYGLRFLVGINFKYIILKKYRWSPYIEANYLGGVLIHRTKGYNPRVVDGEITKFRTVVDLSICAGATYRITEQKGLFLGAGYQFPDNALLLKVGYQFR